MAEWYESPWSWQIYQQQAARPQSGGSTMAAVAPAAIATVGTVGAAVAGGKGAEKAAKVNLEGQREALAFARQQEANRLSEYQRNRAIWEAGRNALLSRYGIDLGAGGVAPPSGSAGVSASPRPMDSQNRIPYQTAQMPWSVNPTTPATVDGRTIAQILADKDPFAGPWDQAPTA